MTSLLHEQQNLHKRQSQHLALAALPGATESLEPALPESPLPEPVLPEPAPPTEPPPPPPPPEATAWNATDRWNYGTAFLYALAVTTTLGAWNT